MKYNNRLEMKDQPSISPTIPFHRGETDETAQDHA
jgi:hypothetical protein